MAQYLRLITFILFLSFFQFCVIGNTVKFPSLGSEREAELTEYVMEGVDKDKILIISIDGVISETPSNSSSLFGGQGGESTVSAVINDLIKASFDRDIKGIILKVNSPGGTVTGSDLIYRELMKYKVSTGIPIVALFMDKAASGGYYVAMAADKIVSLPTAVTGSVGVILSGFNLKEGLDKLGVKDQSITSGPNKAIGSPFSEMKPEQKIILQSIVNNLYDRFFGIVKQNRQNIREERLKELCDGRIFTADQALKEGMIDKVGYIEETVIELMKLDRYAKRATPNNNKPRLVYYSHLKQKVRSVYQIVSEDTNYLNAFSSLLNAKTEIKFMYLWSY
ncbi:MAG: signal peptide peptidase SppA [Leptospiraceae bacterium]|nr:signal peptide peptidase SppA [Leptospiraceae bacterium]